MKTIHIIAVVLFLAGTALFTSCMQRNYYNTNPNNTNTGHNNNNGINPGYPQEFDEEFNGADKYGWSFTNATDSAYASITNGSYQYVDYSAVLSNMSVVNTGVNTQGNFTVITRIKSNKIMGLIFGASATDNGYAFYIDTVGNFSLYKEGAGTTASTTIIAATYDSLAVKNDWNILEVDQTSGNWTGFINGTQVFQMTARTITGSDFGFKILPGTVGYADYLVVKSY